MLATLAVLCLLLGITAGVEAQLEARAQALQAAGATIICAERLNTNQFTLQNGTTWTNPVDTNPNPCSELGDGTSTFTGSWSQFTGSSKGLPQLNFVWGSTSGELKGTRITNSAFRRFASRYYMALDSAYVYSLSVPDPGFCGSAKWWQLSDTSGVVEFQGAQFTRATDPVIRAQQMTQFPSSTNIPFQYTGGFTFDDCRLPTGWCRIEVILSCTGACSAMSGMSIEATAVPLAFQVSQPTRKATLPTTFAGNAIPGVSGLVWEAPNYFHTNSPNTCGFRYVTHILGVAWTTNSGQTIGAATEVEGGGGGPTNTNLQTTVAATTVSGATPVRSIGTVLNPRPMVRFELVAVGLVAIMGGLGLARRRMRR